MRPTEETQIAIIIIGVFYLIHIIYAPSYRKMIYAALWGACLLLIPDFPIKFFNFLVYTILEILAKS